MIHAMLLPVASSATVFITPETRDAFPARSDSSMVTRACHTQRFTFGTELVEGPGSRALDTWCRTVGPVTKNIRLHQARGPLGAGPRSNPGKKSTRGRGVRTSRMLIFATRAATSAMMLCCCDRVRKSWQLKHLGPPGKPRSPQKKTRASSSGVCAGHPVAQLASAVSIFTT